MTKYFLINLKQDEAKTFYENSNPEKDVFICEKCFRILKTNRDNHLFSCDIYFPEEDPVYLYQKDGIRIYKISNRNGKINNKLIRIIEKLSWFSKEEQKIDLRQVTEKMFDSNNYYQLPNKNRFSLYVLFSYKRIIGYLLFSEKYSPNNNIFIYSLSDIYLIKEFRNKGLGKQLFRSFIENEKINFDQLYFNTKISEDLKKLLISEKIKNIKLLSNNGYINEFNL